jgi:hypothetical protein
VALVILLRASWRPGTWHDSQQEVGVAPGTLVTSLDKLAVDARVTRQQARDAISYLENAGFVTCRRTRFYTIVSVQNWARYQAGENSENTPAHSRPPKEHTGEHTGEHSPNRVQPTQNTPDKPSTETAGTQPRTHARPAKEHYLKSEEVHHQEQYVDFVEEEKAKASNDDEKTGTQSETAEARFRTLIDSRHNGTVNAWELMRTVREIVEPWDLSLSHFLDLDAKKTSNPRRIKTPEAYYTSLAQALVQAHRNALRGRASHIQFAVEQEGAKWTGERCLGCGGTGRVGDGYCTHCALGRELEAVERRQAARPSAPKLPKVTEQGEAA